MIFNERTNGKERERNKNNYQFDSNVDYSTFWAGIVENSGSISWVMFHVFSLSLAFCTLNKSYNYPISNGESQCNIIDVNNLHTVVFEIMSKKKQKKTEKYLKHVEKAHTVRKAQLTGNGEKGVRSEIEWKRWMAQKRALWIDWARHWKITNVIWTHEIYFFLLSFSNTHTTFIDSTRHKTTMQ